MPQHRLTDASRRPRPARRRFVLVRPVVALAAAALALTACGGGTDGGSPARVTGGTRGPHQLDRGTVDEEAVPSGEHALALERSL